MLYKIADSGSPSEAPASPQFRQIMVCGRAPNIQLIVRFCPADGVLDIRIYRRRREGARWRAMPEGVRLTTTEIAALVAALKAF